MADDTRTCSIDGCERERHARGWCGAHYAKWLQYRDPLGSAPPPPRLECTVDGCARRRYCHGYCTAHYNRWRTSGDPGPAAISTYTFREQRPPCKVDGCERIPRAHGLCKMHYSRWLKYGDPGDADQRRTKPVITYNSVHKRLAKVKGPASGFSCVDCGMTAAHWSYDHADPEELYEEGKSGTLSYSMKIDHYQPRCIQCHAAFDHGDSPAVQMRLLAF